MKQIYILSSIFFLSFLTLQAQTVINPVSAATSFTADDGTNLINTYNGTGLETFPSLTANHAATAIENSFLAEEITGTIDFNLGGTFLIDGLSFWNQNAGGPPGGVGINSVNFYSSLDGMAYTLIPGAPISFIATTTSISPPESFTFSAVSAAFIRMEVISNHGATRSAFAEIAFAVGASLSDSESLELKSISLYPNPSEDFISISGITDIEDFIVYDVLGKEVLKGTISKNEKINIKDIVSGVYFLRLNNTNSIRFIKK